MNVREDFSIIFHSQAVDYCLHYIFKYCHVRPLFMNSKQGYNFSGIQWKTLVHKSCFFQGDVQLKSKWGKRLRCELKKFNWVENASNRVNEKYTQKIQQCQKSRVLMNSSFESVSKYKLWICSFKLGMVHVHVHSKRWMFLLKWLLNHNGRINQSTFQHYCLIQGVSRTPWRRP